MGYYSRVSSFQVICTLVKVNRKTKWEKIIKKKYFQIMKMYVQTKRFQQPSIITNEDKMMLSQAILNFQNKENFFRPKSTKEEKQNKANKTKQKGVHMSQSRNKTH